ncbi:hypothetical protein DEJ23_11415 [Curtobacterium sp. MCSS17_008]|nr:hypothetical protein DEJ23_11415 [Curtobacterium sp. MCSS17_008]
MVPRLPSVRCSACQRTTLVRFDTTVLAWPV